MRNIAFAAAALVALALTACGGSGGGGSDEDQIKSLGEKINTAVKDKDWSVLCDSLDAETKGKLAVAIALLKVNDCEGVFAKAPKTDLSRGYKLTKIVVTGNTATAVNQATGKPIVLTKANDDRWYIGSNDDDSNETTTTTTAAGSADETTNPDEAAAAQRAVEKLTSAGVGVKLNGIKYTVASPSTEKSISGDYETATAKSGREYVVFKVKARNDGKKPVSFCASQGAVLIDSEDRNYSPESEAGSAAGSDDLCIDKLQPGDTATVPYVFSVKEGTKLDGLMLFGPDSYLTEATNPHILVGLAG